MATRIGAQTRELTLAAASIVVGIALFWHNAWARKLALGLLLIEAFYGSEAFAWGFEWTADASCPSILTFRHGCVERVVVLSDLSIGAVTGVPLDYPQRYSVTVLELLQNPQRSARVRYMAKPRPKSGEVA